MSDTSTELEVLPPSGKAAVAWWSHNPMIPSSFKKDGQVDFPNLERACRISIKLDMDPVTTVGDMFVIKDQIGFKADLQRHLLMRVPGYDFEILEADDEHVTARVKTKGEWKAPLTKRITDTDIQVYANRAAPGDKYTGDGFKNANYREKPRRMLEARVTTELIDMYAKGVLRGWLMPMGIDVSDEYEPGDGPAPVGEVPSGPAPRSLAPDGSTIPEHLREPEVDEETRQLVKERMEQLPPEQREALRELWIEELRAPHYMRHWFTRAHGALLLRMINEISAPVSGSVPTVTDPGVESRADPETGEVIPPAPAYTPEEEEPF